MVFRVGHRSVAKVCRIFEICPPHGVPGRNNEQKKEHVLDNLDIIECRAKAPGGRMQQRTKNVPCTPKAPIFSKHERAGLPPMQPLFERLKRCGGPAHHIEPMEFLNLISIVFLVFCALVSAAGRFVVVLSGAFLVHALIAMVKVSSASAKTMGPRPPPIWTVDEVGGALLGAISIGLAIAALVVALVTRARKILRYAYESERVVDLDDEVRESVEGEYKGAAIDGSVHRVKVRLCNGGNREFRKDDFVGALKIDIGESGQVLEYTQAVGDVEVEVVADERGVAVECGALNPKESVLVTMLLNEWDGGIEVRGKILGAKVARYPSGAVCKGVLLMAAGVVSIGGTVMILIGHSPIWFLLSFGPWLVVMLSIIIPAEYFGEFLRIVCRLPKV